MNLNELDKNWMKEAPALTAINRLNPFSVPDNYFKDLESHLSAGVLLDKEKLEDNAFTVPNSYFDNLHSQITSQIALQDTITDTGFTVPEGYFDKLNQQIVKKTAVRQSAKIRPLKYWVNYAAAASILIAIATSIFINRGQSNLQNKLSNVPDQEIINYLELHADAGDTPVIIDNLEGEPVLTKDIPEKSLQQSADSTIL